MKKSKWQIEAEYWLAEEEPAWWEIAIPAVVMVILIGVIIVSSWVAA